MKVSQELNGKKHVIKLFDSKTLHLECGQTLSNIRVAFETFGTLSKNKDNIILICHALTGDSHVTSHESENVQKGWWESAVGPGKAIDTNKYFVVCSNTLGGCRGTEGPSSVKPDTGSPWGGDFPIITIKDTVHVQAELLNHLGINKLLAVIGGSFGALQCIEWAVSYPQKMKSIVVFTGAGRWHPMGIANHYVMRRAIMSDPEYKNGHYYPGEGPSTGLSIARSLITATCRSDESMWKQFGRKIRPLHLLDTKGDNWDDGYGQRPDVALPNINVGNINEKVNGDIDRGFGIAYEIESYLKYNGDALVKRFDANSFLYLTRAMDFHNIGRGYQSYQEAFNKIKAEALVFGVRTDIAQPPYLQKDMVDRINKSGGKAQYIELDSLWGHDAFLTEFNLASEYVSSFLSYKWRNSEEIGIAFS